MAKWNNEEISQPTRHISRWAALLDYLKSVMQWDANSEQWRIAGHHMAQLVDKAKSHGLSPRIQWTGGDVSFTDPKEIFAA